MFAEASVTAIPAEVLAIDKESDRELRTIQASVHPEPTAIPNQDDVHASSNSRCSFPPRRPSTNPSGTRASACRTAAGPSHAYASVTDA
jgi:hypothetical protein